MGFAVVSSTALFEAGRMDAGYHILRSRHASRVANLKKTLTPDRARKVVANLRLGDLQVLSTLSRGSIDRNLTRDDVNRIIRDDPHLALAIVADHLDEMGRKAREEAEAARSYVETIEDMGDDFADLPAPGM